jgi:hypothetical protein
MTKRYRSELREPQRLLIFCMSCRRVIGCKNSSDGGMRIECTNCSDTRYCCAGCVIDTVPDQNLKKRATSGICKSCLPKFNRKD